LTVTIDKSGANRAALEAVNAERETRIQIRQIKYPNNIVEQSVTCPSRKSALDSVWPSVPEAGRKLVGNQPFQRTGAG
jgi:transposase-like protein